MRVVNPTPGREPLQPLPTMQRPLTPPQSQRHSPKYGGMAKAEPSSAKKDGKLQVATREEINLYDSTSDGEPEFYDFEDDGQDAAGTSTVKMSDRQARMEAPSSSTGWQISSTVRPASPSKPAVHIRAASQITSPAQSRYAISDGTGLPSRTSATSSTAVSPASPSVTTFNSNLPPRPPTKPQQRKYDALEDILLPALDKVFLSISC
jgi:hypothetical protein